MAGTTYAAEVSRFTCLSFLYFIQLVGVWSAWFHVQRTSATWYIQRLNVVLSVMYENVS